MINTSNEYDNKIMDDRVFILNADITLSDNTVLKLDDTDIIQGGMEFEDATSGTSSFQIGAAIINKHILTIQNFDGKFDTYDFTGATVIPYVGLQLSETVESLKKGFYTVDEPNAVGGIISLECLDNMHKFERPFKEVTLNFPTTAGNALQVICIYCGVSLATTTFTNSNYIIQSRPDDEALSCLDMVSYIAQIAGCFARCNRDGAIEIKWYDTTAFEHEDSLDGGSFDSSNPYASGDSADGGNFTDYNSGDSFDGGTFLELKKFWHLYDFGSTPTIAVDDVVITGIKVENTDSENGYSSLFGLDGYVLSIVNNPLIQSQSDADVIVNSVGAKIVGMRFRPFSASVLSNPAIEAGDPAKLSVRARDGFNVYHGYITNLSYKVGSRETVKNSAETPSRNSSTRYSEATKTIIRARQNTRQQLTSYDIAVQQLTNLMVNSFGAFKSEEKLEDGSTIYYMHNKPTRAESQTIWKMTADAFAVSTDGGQTWNAGIDSQGNAVVNVLSAIGVNAEWIKVLSTFTVGNNFEVNSDGILRATNANLTGKITANSGKIGPFEISNQGLMSDIMQFFENNDYPLIWLTKKGPNGEEWGANNTERANLEPSVMVVRSKDNNGLETDVSLIARKNPGSGRTGEIIINKWGNGVIHDSTLSTDGIYINKQESGVQLENIELTPHGLFLLNENGYYTFVTPSGSITFSEEQVVFYGANCQIAMSESGDIGISGSKGSIYMTDDTYINSPGDIYLNGFPANLQQMQNDIMKIKAKLNMS